MDNNPLDYPTINQSEIYHTKLEELRARRTQITSKLQRARSSVQSIKFGSIRAVYEKKLDKLEKLSTKIDDLMSRLETLYNETFEGVDTHE